MTLNLSASLLGPDIRFADAPATALMKPLS
jgi:hypothetical protein